MNKVIKILTIVISTLFLGCALLWFFSPFGSFRSDVIKTEVISNTSCSTVFNYLGNSDNAKDWSVFVDHISTINSEEVADGKIGSKRKCYTLADETGFTWEEEVLELKENAYRKISCYNYKDLSIGAPDLVTEQIYLSDDAGCKVSFTLDFKEEPSFGELLKMKFSAYRIQDIFQRNLENIKMYAERASS